MEDGSLYSVARGGTAPGITRALLISANTRSGRTEPVVNRLVEASPSDTSR